MVPLSRKIPLKVAFAEDLLKSSPLYPFNNESPWQRLMEYVKREKFKKGFVFIFYSAHFFDFAFS